ncbi:MAG: class I SAM-dependent methyltransferase [Acidobacteriota bacterium]
MAISRVPRSHQQAQATYDRISGWYDLLEGDWERAPKKTALHGLRIREGDRVLEIGCGTGETLLQIAEATGSSGRVHGLDLSPRMLARASARLARSNLFKQVTFENADATLLPFRDGYFDAIFMSFVLELFDTPEIPTVLHECRRVLRAGGRMGIVALSQAGGSNWMREVYERGHAKFPNLLDCRPILVKAALEEAGVHTLESVLVSLWGLPVEIVRGVKLE